MRNCDVFLYFIRMRFARKTLNLLYESEKHILYLAESFWKSVFQGSLAINNYIYGRTSSFGEFNIDKLVLRRYPAAVDIERIMNCNSL